MKIALICPSDMLYMPYVKNYTNILINIGIDYTIINWDRFGIEVESEFVYRDSKTGHQRSFLDYFKYTRFVLNILKNKHYDKIIVFGIQLVFFLKQYLTKEYINEYIIDIRDYNRIIKYFNIQNSINNSVFTVLSSPGYKDWLPKSDKYIINHNTIIESLDELRAFNLCDLTHNKMSIACIGALRDYQINIDLIESLKNNELIHLNYHGEGNINKNISKYLIDNKIKNVSLIGRYGKEQEEGLYCQNDFINVLRYSDGINNKTALPNRLYNAVLYGNPMLAFEGTQLSYVIEYYNLGIVIRNFNNIENDIADYVNNFNVDLYKNGRISFSNIVIEENKQFLNSFKEFLR